MINISENTWQIATNMDLNTTADLEKKYRKLLPKAGSWIIDFSRCIKIDSSGLALIIEYIKYADKNGVNISLVNLCEDTLKLSEIYGI